jgi:GH25 family lysozyme M1 (1,4-beta-N-acetylmuramidase)
MLHVTHEGSSKGSITMKPGVRARRVALVVVTGVAASSLLLGVVTAANAGQIQPPSTPRVTVSPAVAAWIQANDHQMGSEIRKHEKVATVLRSAVAGATSGMDVSGYQGNVNWAAAAANGAKFAYVKATEGTYYANPYFSQQFSGSRNVGIIRGAYHFARPDTTTGAVQADYFIANGGGWSPDGATLPGALDIEWNPYGAACYGLSQAAVVTWIHSFVNEYRARTTRWPLIYTANSWWAQCTGNLGDFSANDSLWLANFSSTPGPMPYQWTVQRIWQNADTGTFPGDQDFFNGDITRLRALAAGCAPTAVQIAGHKPTERIAILPGTKSTCFALNN